MSVGEDQVVDAVATILAAQLEAHGVGVEGADALMGEVSLALRLKMRASSASDSLMISMRLADISRNSADRRCDGGDGKTLTCLECQKPFQMLKRHLLKTHNGMTPEKYRKKHHLPQEAPMVAGEYAKLRSRLAKKSGLGKRSPSRVAKPKQGRKKK